MNDAEKEITQSKPRRRRRKRCWRCRYFGPVTGTVGTCDYLLETGHARSLICPPGAECTVFKPAGTLRRRRRFLEPPEPENGWGDGNERL